MDAFIGFMAAIITTTLVVGYATMIYTERDIMQQAFERGYAVQCIGKTGYHWECGK